MARLTDRPYGITWTPNLRKVIKNTPDSIVFLNGDVSVPGCPSCGGRVDIQKYITSVSAEPSTNPIATSSISLSVPGYESHGLFRDGQFLLEPGLEVHVYMRGFFPATGLLEGDDSARVADPTGAVINTAMYPYYLVFHGVVVSTSFSYSGGNYSASLSCADLLHFWQYQRLVEQGAVLADNFAGSKVDSSLVGHNFSGMSPYSIIYTLYRDTMGAAGGIETVVLPDSDVTNASSVSSVDGQPLFKHAERYWKKRFSQTIANLRMFGANGSLYTAAQAAFLARLDSEQISYLAARADNPSLHTVENDPMAPLLRQARAVGFDPYTLFNSTAGGVSGTVGGDDSGAGLGINAASFQAYVSDISKWGQFNLFETTYLTKLEIANAVTQVTGFEFYQDVDGDIVFKPPFYNMDTSGLRVYRIEPEDVISFDTQDKEPDCTVVKITGGQFSNQAGIDLTGEFGIRAEFVDFRAVAKYGWRQEVFDSSYFNDARSAFYAAIARYDIYNIGVKSASVTIPLRPELRPGYPVYIAHLDCFYYVTSVSHSFSFGSQCTTSLTLVGRRAKFHGPGVAPSGGRLPGIDDIDLSNMHLPELPLTLPGVVTGSADTAGYATGDPSNPYVSDPYAGSGAVRRTQGIPNVVMTLDPNLTPPLTRDYSSLLEDLSTADGVRKVILSLLGTRNSPLQRSPNATGNDKSAAYDGPFQIQVENGQWKDLPSFEQIATVARQAKAEGKSWKPASSPSSAPSTAQFEVEQAYGALLAAATRAYDQTIPGGSETAYALERASDFKSMFSPGKAVPKGYYRYYTSAHPDVDQQGMRSLAKDGRAGGVIRAPEGTRATQFTQDGSGFTVGPVSGGIPIALAGGGTVVKPTHLITSFDLARLEVELDVPVNVQPTSSATTFPPSDLSDALSKFFTAKFSDLEPGDEIAGCQELFETERARIVKALQAIPAPPRLSSKGSGVFGLDVLTNAEGVAEYVTSAWNPQRLHPTEKVIKPHRGTDLRAPVGTPVKAANQGRVSYVRATNPSDSAGLYLEVEHGSVDPAGKFTKNGWKTRYLHLSRIDVQKGQWVSAGQQIALSGNSGLRNSWPHLHFELRLNGADVDPQRHRLDGDGFVAVSAASSVSPGVEAVANAPFPAFASVSDVGNVFLPFAQTPAYLQYGTNLPPTSTSPVQPNQLQLLNLARTMGDALAKPTAEVLNEYSRRDPDRNRQFASVWSSLFPNGAAPTPLSLSVAAQTPTKRKVSVEVPVFPVSDARGYEVVGTYSYGRGINLMTDQQTNLQRVSGGMTDWSAVDAFVSSVQSNGSSQTAGVAEAIGKMDLDTRADLAATTLDPVLRDVLTPPAPGKAGRGENVPSSSAQGVGVFSPVNAAYGLADMRVGALDACQCYLNQPDVLFLTGGVEFDTVAVVGNQEDFLQAVTDQMSAKVPGWAATQDAYRGGSTTYDSRTTADIVRNSADQIRRTLS